MMPKVLHTGFSKAVVFAAIVSFALFLSGCSTSPPSKDETSPSIDNTTPSDDSTASDEYWIISSKGVGPYALGQPYEMLPTDTNLPGCSYSVRGNEGYGNVAIVDLENLHWDSENPPKLTIDAVLAMGWGDGPMLMQTAEGIGPGSSRVEVETAYPDAEYFYDERSGAYLVIIRDEVPITFELETEEPTSLVTAVAVGRDTPMSGMPASL